MHSTIFCIQTLSEPLSDGVLIYWDLETTGVCLTQDEIVEIGAISVSGQVFSTVVKPTTLPTGPSVHGIDNDELVCGPSFNKAFDSFVQFLNQIANETVVDDDESSDDDEVTRVTRFKDAPQILLVGHNALRFDCPMLLSECVRKGARFDVMTDWAFADSLHVVRLTYP